MTDILTAFQTFGTPGAIVISVVLVARYLGPDLREVLRAGAAAFKALAELAARTDQRLAGIERTTAETNEGMAVLLDRRSARPAVAKRPAPEGVR